jgi:hypothetical protein
MDRDDRVPFLGSHLGEGAIAHDPGVVHHGVEPSERLNRLVDQALGRIDFTAVAHVGGRGRS